MLYFLIPLRSKASSKDWDKVTLDFNNTLNSVFNQNNSDFKVLVALHDIPEVFNDFGDKLELIKVDYPEPNLVEYKNVTRLDQQRLDKYTKKRFLMQRVRELGGGYTMFVDADDFISNKIADYIAKKEPQHGVIFENGYEFYPKKFKIKKCPHFNNICGTSAVIYYTPEELPETARFEGYHRQNIFRSNNFLFDFGHNKWSSIAKSIGKHFDTLPFRGAMYSLETGENVSLLRKDNNKLRQVVRLVNLNKTPSNKVIEEFKLPVSKR